MAALLEMIREVGEDVLEVADRVTAQQGSSTITVTLDGYRLIRGCMAVSAESPKCCTANPCPVCSLIACLLAEGLKETLLVEHCSADPDRQSVTAVFSRLS
jgi:hypothetical protein